MKAGSIDWKAIVEKGENPNINRSVYVQSRHHSTWDQLKREHPGNYYKTSLVRSIYSLAVTPGGRQNGFQTLNLDGAQINYQINTVGDVLIYVLNIDSAVSAPVVDQATGLYRVYRDGVRKTWEADSQRQNSMEHSHRWNNAHYAAVSGKFDDKEEAARLLIDHIIPAYNAALKPKDLDEGKKHYSLFWQNGQYQNKPNSRALTALIQQAQTSDARISWLVHGEGAGTFVQALQSLTKKPTVSGLVANKNDLANQSVFFSNPRGKNTHEKELKTLCETAGMHLVGVNFNSSDMKNLDARKAAQEEAGKIIGKYVIGGGATVVGLSNLEKAINLGGATDTALVAIGFGVAGYTVAKDIWTKFSGYARNVASAPGNTWGSGNKQWAA